MNIIEELTAGELETEDIVMDISTEDSTIEGNYFVSDTLSGIDGVSYANHAEPMEYDDLISSSNTTEIFEEFKLTFKQDNKLVDIFILEYGDSLAEEDSLALNKIEIFVDEEEQETLE